MIRNVAIASVLVAAFAAAAPHSVQAQEKASDAQFVADKKLAKAGKTLWSGKGCMACHTIGKGKMAGPDLNGLFERRSVEWIQTWLKDPTPMFETDETAKQLLKEWNGMKMPNMKLSESDIEAVMHYLASEQKSKK